jgi:ABC-type amino acid transport substrate-binding protein
MTEARLRAAWRRHTAAGAPAAALAEPLEGLQDGASVEHRTRAAALMAEDARAADLGRALSAIHADARKLESEFFALRQPRRWAGRLPRAALALAAMLALAAVIALPQWRGSAAPGLPAGSGDVLIAASSFEAERAAVAAPADQPLFRAGFDS